MRNLSSASRSRREKIRNEVTRRELGVTETIIEKIRKRRLSWFGHVERMDEKRIANAALHGHVEGERSRGRQRKTWMDNIREDLKKQNTEISKISEIVRDREKWRNFIKASSLGN